eukprot:CAMPEP_0179051090 /NCGR_PEP_ID=MMETSP0796-20121207/21068_1 /TAXON_ID=73915 /ORGANISM="Pyrodinium bahamense, Strain pbaha01" /LENGTH=239 /DNA_ID=CAMNT_0020747625 /DNA_START=106 /DNA_END=825 /DNA_ORIENTATION=-
MWASQGARRSPKRERQGSRSPDAGWRQAGLPQLASNEEPHTGRLSGFNVLVQYKEGSRLANLCKDECYGSASDQLGAFLLTLEEALFLVAELRALVVECKGGTGTVNADAFFRSCCTTVLDFPQRYAAYRHLRLAGWVVRPDALKFGADFLLYDGRVSECHAQYAVIIAKPTMQWKDVLTGSRLALLVAKELLLVMFLSGTRGELLDPTSEVATLSSFVSSQDARITEIAAKQWFPHLG